MSRSFVTTPPIPIRPYQGTVVSIPIPIYDARKKNGVVAPIFIDWRAYGAVLNPSLGVSVSIQGGPAPVMPQIMSVYIDNTNGDVPIYIVFPDTNFVVTCKPYSTLYVPVLTASIQCVVYCLDMEVQAIPQTRIFLIDTHIEGFSDTEQDDTIMELLSSTVSPFVSPPRGNFFPAALGDLVISDRLDLVTGTFIRMFTRPNFTGAPLITTGVNIMTSLSISVSCLIGVPSVFGFGIFNITESVVLNLWHGSVKGDGGNEMFVNLSNLNWRFDATKVYQWGISTAYTGAQAYLNLVYGLTANANF